VANTPGVSHLGRSCLRSFHEAEKSQEEPAKNKRVPKAVFRSSEEEENGYDQVVRGDEPRRDCAKGLETFKSCDIIYT
jgi:hypothetical protein